MRATPDPMAELPETADALRALLLAAWAERDGVVAERDSIASERDRIAVERDALALQNDRLRHLLLKLKRMQFGAKSERLPEAQLQLGLEDIEQAIAQGEADAERRDPALKQARAAKRRARRGALPAHLPRLEVMLEPEDTACPCCHSAMTVIGHDSSERLDVIPTQFRVVVTRRPKLACRACEGVIVQAPAPARLIEGGVPTEALVAHVLVARYADHLPLYRQAQMMARQGVALDRSTLAFWVGYAAVEIAPVVARLREILLASARLFADETRVPVLDPGRGRTKTGYFWTIARDDRPWGGADPPAVAYSYAPGRGQEHNDRLLGAYRGIVQCDGYATYKALADPKRGEAGVTLVYCWSHVRRGFYDLAKTGTAPIATEALARIAALYRIEAEVRGQDAGHRLEVRQAKSRPLVADLRVWFEAQAAKLPARGPTAGAIRYALNHWDGLERFLDDGRIELGRVEDRRGSCSRPLGCRQGFRSAPSSRASMTPFPVPARQTGHADLPHPAFSQSIRPSLSAGRHVAPARGRGRVSHRGTRPGSGGTRCLVVPRGASTSAGYAAPCSSGRGHRCP
jgi:transposase